jgi:hypothetical protein
MKRHRPDTDRRALHVALASGALLLQGGCPFNLDGLLAAQAQQVFANTVFFLLDSVVVRVT